MTYNVQITETLQRVIPIQADNEQEAYTIARAKYRSCDVILDDDDYKNTDITVLEE